MATSAADSHKQTESLFADEREPFFNTIGQSLPTHPTPVPTDVRFSNRPFGVKHFQAIHHCSVDVAHGLVLLSGIGTRALPSWDSKTRWNNLLRGLAVK